MQQETMEQVLNTLNAFEKEKVELAINLEESRKKEEEAKSKQTKLEQELQQKKNENAILQQQLQSLNDFLNEDLKTLTLAEQQLQTQVNQIFQDRCPGRNIQKIRDEQSAQTS